VTYLSVWKTAWQEIRVVPGKAMTAFYGILNVGLIRRTGHIFECFLTPTVLCLDISQESALIRPEAATQFTSAKST
jgi:hypothetical protein